MKFYQYLFVIASLLVANSALAASNQVTDAILTPPHPTYQLRLDSNPTTGYAWYVEHYDQKYLTLISHHYIPSKTHLIGAGGKEVWVFSAKPNSFKVPRVNKISMVYARPWDVAHGTFRTFYVVTTNQ